MNCWAHRHRYRDVWIVVPAFNEAAVIGDVSPICGRCSTMSCAWTTAAGRHREHRQAGGAHVVRHPVNLGQGAAIQTGVEYARSQPGAQVFVTFDADGQHRVKDVFAMIDRLGAEDVDIVIGTRFAAGAPARCRY